MSALTPTQIVPTPQAYVDPGQGAMHDHGSVETLLANIAGGNTGAGNALGFTTRGPFASPHRYTWHILIGGTGSLTALTVNLEGSLDGTNWAQLDQSTNAAGEMRHVVNKPIRYVRANIVTSTVNSGAPTISVIFGE